jgi:transcriptional regulator with XRE-family HTH domain
MTFTFQSLVLDLMDAGLSMAEIGRRINTTRSAVNEIAKGRTKSPRGAAALHLHELHRKVCGKARKTG